MQRITIRWQANLPNGKILTDFLRIGKRCEGLNPELTAFCFDDSHVRVAAVSPEVRVADVAFNTQAVIESLAPLRDAGVRLACFPELGLTGYTCADLFYQSLLREEAEAAVMELSAAAGEFGICLIVGLPIAVLGRLYNAAIFIDASGPVGIVPKSYLPNAAEFYEARWFARGEALCLDEIDFAGKSVPIGSDLIFQCDCIPAFRVGIEVCEDVWVVNPPSADLAVAGATVIANLSASDELLGKADYRRNLIAQQSGRCMAAYLYAAAGPGESSTDLVYGGHCLIAENGRLMAESARFQFETSSAVADVSLDFLVAERLRNAPYRESQSSEAFRFIPFSLPESPDFVAYPPLVHPPARHPFVPSDPAGRDAHCEEVFAIQSTGLATRLRHIPGAKLVIGVSGGLDSTLALLVCAAALQKLGRPASDIVAVGMPGPGSTDGTQTNANDLAMMVGAEFRSIPIHAAVESHLAAIGHPSGTYDVTFENAQARERTQILMNLANQVGGIVVGTGDLSEAALGWCTFNGDHMSMYHVNAGVPKTLVRYVIDWVASHSEKPELARTLKAVSATPITPELLPLGVDGALIQKTEDVLGSYALHDFFLFHTIRRQSRPRLVFGLACLAFEPDHTPHEILATLRTFYRRFFASQFKRSSMPDGPKVGTVALSPRGDWRMPSDAACALWMTECDAIEAQLQSPTVDE